MADSDIEWTDKTWNPTKGCSKISPGCMNCYAIRMAHRLNGIGHHAYQETTRRSGNKTQWSGQINLDYKALMQPYSWKKPARVFVNSMSDLFHESIPVSFMREIWEVMQKTPHLQYQILTKRDTYMQKLLQDQISFPVLPNVWLGVSVESEDYLDRLDVLRNTPALIRFASLEPLLGPLTGINLAGIDWAIVGGESGPGARPLNPEWLEEIEYACRRSETAFFFKQWGGAKKKKTGRHWKGQTWDEYPLANQAVAIS